MVETTNGILEKPDERLQDDTTGLYYQSPGYVYSFLQNELNKAKVA